jgi:hypothetical protein
VYQILVRKHEGKRSLGRYACKWKDNIKIDVQVIGCEEMGWINCLRIDTIGGLCEHSIKPSGVTIVRNFFISQVAIQEIPHSLISCMFTNSYLQIRMLVLFLCITVSRGGD